MTTQCYCAVPLFSWNVATLAWPQKAFANFLHDFVAAPLGALALSGTLVGRARDRRRLVQQPRVGWTLAKTGDCDRACWPEAVRPLGAPVRRTACDTSAVDTQFRAGENPAAGSHLAVSAVGLGARQHVTGSRTWSDLTPATVSIGFLAGPQGAKAVNQAQAFLDSIFETPEDDTVRMVYADWLEENGQPERAEFIRLQVEAARLPEGAAQAALEAQAKRVADEHEPDWLAGTGLPPAVIRFHRGFPDALDFSTADWGVELESGRTPIPEEGLLLPLLTALRSWAELRFVRRLILDDDNGAGAGAIRVLADAPEYGHLSELFLMRIYLNPADFERLASSKTLTRLRVLSVPRVDNYAAAQVGGTGCAAIAGSPNFAQLEVLALPEAKIGDAGAVALASSPHLSNLFHLDLCHNSVGDAGAFALASSPHLRAVRELVFVGNEASPDAIRALEARFGDLTNHPVRCFPDA